MSVPKPILRESLREPSVALSPSYGGVASADRAALRINAWFLTAVLLLMPLAAYWPATFHDYGLRDDYSNLREAHEEPRTVLKFCASHARPIYGWLLQATYGQTSSVQNLQWMRFCAALLLGAVGLVMFRGLKSLGWPAGGALCFALLVQLVPSSQVIAAWAVGWPYAATALLAIAGFFTVDGIITGSFAGGRARIAGQGLLALGLMVSAALIYQPSALFYTVPLAGALVGRRQRDLRASARWLALHTGFVVVTLGLAYCTMSVLYATGVFVKSGRIAFEHHWGEKLAWFLGETLPNGLSLFVLNDNNGRDHWLYLAGAALTGALLLGGLAREWRRHGRARGIIWAIGLFGLPVFAAGVSLIASERYATYRTIFAMTAVLLCFLVASVQALTDHWTRPARRVLAAAAIILAVCMAQHHAYSLIAVPQGHEWELILDGARRVHLDAPSRPRIFAIASSPRDISTDTIYHDEFGSLSSNSEWVPKEMFKRAMHDLHPGIHDLEARYDFSEGYRLPPGRHFDVVIDMHQLRRFHSDN